MQTVCILLLPFPRQSRRKDEDDAVVNSFYTPTLPQMLTSQPNLLVEDSGSPKKQIPQSQYLDDLNISLPSTRKEHLNNEHLQARHTDHQRALDDGEVEDAALGALHGAEVAVLARAEVLLLARQAADLVRQTEHAFFHGAELVVGGAVFDGD